MIDYDFIRLAIKHRIEQGHINLQETLVDDVARALLAHPAVRAVRVSSENPMCTTTSTQSASKSCISRKVHERAASRAKGLREQQARKSALRLTSQAIAQFNMIEAGDKIMVCLSGGKDSYSLLELLLLLRQRAPIDFDIVAVNLDQKQPGFPEDVLPKYLRTKACPFTSKRRTRIRSSSA